MPELSKNIHNQIEAFCVTGDSLTKIGDFASALNHYWQAWDLLPFPQSEWDASTWILAAIGDANFLNKDFQAGRDNLSHAMHCPHAVGNPFLHLRLGQCLFELGNTDTAIDELARAYMGAGADLFNAEDPKYFTFLKSRLQPPPNGQW